MERLDAAQSASSIGAALVAALLFGARPLCNPAVPARRVPPPYDPSGATMLERIAAALGALCLAGCASTQIDAQWTNPDYRGRSLRGAPGARRLRGAGTDAAADLRGPGGEPGRGDGRGADPRLATGRVRAPRPPRGRIRISRPRGASARARSCAPRSTTGAVVAAPAGPTIGIGIGGGGGSVGGFGGLSFPVGGTRVNSAYATETAIIDPANGAIMWSARGSSSASQDTTSQIAELAQTAAGAMKQAGFF